MTAEQPVSDGVALDDILTTPDVDPEAARAALADVPWEPGAPKPDPILVAERVVRNFGGLRAVSVDHVEIQRGVITALIGPNGAGKTTFFNLLTNFDTPDEGHRTFDGHDIDNVPAHKIANFGMVRTFQLTKALSKMTVIENMKLGATGQRGEKLWRSILPFMWDAQEADIERRADALLARFKMDHMRDEYAGTLSGGQRKLLLDEPMAGVNPALTQSLLGHVTGLRDQGMTVLFVEHDMDMVQEISDWVIVMAEGEIIAEGPPGSIGQNQAVVDAYLGSHHDAALSFDEDEEDST